MESFGSVVMVTNFLCTYQSLIYPDSTNVITTKALLKALGEGEGGFETLSDVLIAILQVRARAFYTNVDSFVIETSRGEGEGTSLASDCKWS